MELTAEQVREAIEANSWAETSTIREFNDSSWQSIADELNAALGDAYAREECEASFVHGYSLGTLPVGSDPQWDEHMAELGWVRERTCRNLDHDSCWFECSECKCTCSVDYWGGGLGIPNYCPDCGAKVVSK